jgi:hypothetical protein
LILDYKASPPSYPAPIRAFYFADPVRPSGHAADVYLYSAAPAQKVSGASMIEEFNLEKRFTEEKWNGRRGSNSQLSAWESKFSILYFQYLQNRSEKMCVHALHTVHAMPELRIAGDVWGTVCRSER